MEALTARTPLHAEDGTDTARTPEGGKGLDGVVEKAPDYFNPFLEILEAAA